MRVQQIRDLPEGFVANRVRASILYDMIERRNEWTDWHGSTSLVNRSSNYAVLQDVDTREALQLLAERRRKQGSVFVIRAIPVIVLENKKHCLLVGEQRTEKPLFGLMSDPNLQRFQEQRWVSIFSALMQNCLRRSQGFILAVVDRTEIERLDRISADTVCFNFESRATGVAASLGWGSAGRVSISEFDAFLKAVKSKKKLDETRLRLASSSSR